MLKNMKNVMKEIINIVIKFVSPYGLSDDMLEIPKNVKRMGAKVYVIDFCIYAESD